MDLPSPNEKPFSPDEIERLRAELAALTSRVERLEGSSRPSSFRVPEASFQRSESGLGLTLVNRIGAITLALGVLFFFKYAADNNWIGPLARILLGTAFGIVFLAFGELLTRRRQRALALGISGCGLAVLYISVYAASAYFKLLLPGASLVFMVLTCVLELLLALRYASESLAVFGVALACLTLPVMHGQTYVGLSFPYLLVTACAALFLGVFQGWVVLIPLTLAFVLLSAASVNLGGEWFTLLCCVLAGAHWFGRTRAAGSPTLSAVLYVTGHAALLIGGLRAIGILFDQASVVLTIASILLTVYGIALLSLGVSRSSYVDRATGLTLVGLVIAKLYLYDVWRLQYGFRVTAFVALGILLLGASFVYSRYKTRA